MIVLIKIDISSNINFFLLKNSVTLNIISAMNSWTKRTYPDKFLETHNPWIFLLTSMIIVYTLIFSSINNNVDTKPSIIMQKYKLSKGNQIFKIKSNFSLSYSPNEQSPVLCQDEIGMAISMW